MPLIATGTVVDSSDLFASKGWTTYAPKCSGSASTSNTFKGGYINIGNVCIFKASFSFTTASTGTGTNWQFTIPKPAATAGAVSALYEQVAGAVTIRTSTGGRYQGTALLWGTTSFRVTLDSAAGNYVGASVPTANWVGGGSAAGDHYLRAGGWYATT